MKQFTTLRGRPVLLHSVEAFEKCAGIHGYVVVTGRSRVGAVRRMLAGHHKLMAVCAGGDRRSDSVRSGLALLPVRGIVAVHDSARPLLTPRMLAQGLAACRRDGPVTFARPPADTIKRVRGHRIVATLDRSELVAVETPQFFPIPLLRRAHAGGADATDDCSLVERLGVRPRWIETPRPNLKITTRHDSAMVEALL